MGPAWQIGYLLALGVILTLYFAQSGWRSSASAMISFPVLDRVVHEGDIVLKGNESMTLDRINYTQIGDIVITDNPTLRIASSILRMDGLRGLVSYNRKLLRAPLAHGLDYRGGRSAKHFIGRRR